jgi:hypothetical protein
MTDLIISEVYDPASGNNHYIEIFNGTSGTVNLNTPNNYTIQVWNNPSTTNTFDISGSIAPGEVKVYYAGSNGGAASPPAQGAGVGFNEDDEIRLLKNGSVIDRMVAPDNTGFNWRRLNSVTGPNAVYTSSEWSLRQEVDGSLSPTDIGTFTATTNLDFTTQPADQTCTFSMNAVGTGSITAYQWKYYNQTTNAWENVTSGAFPFATIPTSGLGSPTSTSLSITGNFAGYLDYQFYLEIRSGTACNRASNAAQYKYDTRPLYRSKASGDWTSTSTWEMFDTNSGAWIPVCTYPTSVNSDDVTIKASHTVILDIDNKIDKLTIDVDGTLMSSSSAELQILNGNAGGADFIINGIYIDSANSANSLRFTDASWQMGANGTLVRCNSSSAGVYRDNYQGGMSNIPSTANWKIRYQGTNVSFTTATGGVGSGSFPSATYYPNLTFESYSGAWNPPSTVTSSRFSGNASTATILGSLDVGGSGSGTVTLYNENRNASPILINGNLTIRSGSTVTNVGNVDGTGFDVDGNLNVDGSLLLNSGDTGVLKITGSLMQTMTGTGRVELFDLEFNNSNGAAPNVMHALSDSVYNSLSILGTTRLHMGSGNLTLKSSINRTARVAAIPTTAGITYANGKFVVERYIGTGTVHERTWQFLATPTQGQTIFQAWQESGNNTLAGYGTQITGPVVANGIDTETFAPSLKTYNSNTNLWEGISNTNVNVYNTKGYMLFVRGDRQSIVSTTNQPTAVPTILRTAGSIHQPSDPPASIPVSANQWVSVGNPYASPINLSTFFNSTTVSNNFYQSVSLWDPSMYGYYAVGGYQTISGTLDYKPSPGGTTYYPGNTVFKDIQSGQAFFIQAGSAGGTISFDENVKSSTDRLVSFSPVNTGSPAVSNSFAPASNSRNTKQIFRTFLFTASGNVADGNGVAFDRRYENAIDLHDAYKAYNPGENFGMNRNGSWLAVEARSPIERTDTIFYSMYNLKLQDYQLRFTPENMQGGNLKAWLVDKYLDKRTEVSLSDSSFVNISINADPGSSRPDRFYLVFMPRNTHEPKPVPVPKTKNTAELVSGYEALEDAERELSASIYPNPVAGKKIELRLEGFGTGTYRYNLANSYGQVVLNGQLSVSAGKIIKTIVLPNSIAAGVYQLNILAGKSQVKSLQTVIQ